jgi:tetratricopeptide (TPR) repeat protein
MITDHDEETTKRDLPLALIGTRPRVAIARARSLLERDPAPYEASVARQTIGVMLRDFGALADAERELRMALRLARRSGDKERQADVLTSLGTVLVQAGHTRRGLGAMDAAAEQARGEALGRVLMRRGGTLQILGRNTAALPDLRRALTLLRDDPAWQARTRTWLGMSYLGTGDTERADEQFRAAESVLAALPGEEFQAALAVHNRALVAFRAGDLPAALRHFDAAAARYAALAVPMPDLAIDRCAALLAAGLPAEAYEEVEVELTSLELRRGPATKLAELRLAAARTALAAGYRSLAATRAGLARRAFASQGREWFAAHARLLELSAKAPEISLAAAESVAGELVELGSDEVPTAWLLAGRVALAKGRMSDARRCLDAAAEVRLRRKLPPLSRVSGWLAAALRAEADGDRKRVLGACRMGLRVLDEFRLTLGAPELRAQATAHGAELAELAVRAAMRAGSPRLVLEWSERWRATELTAPAPRPAADPQIRADLAALRQVTRRLDEVRGMAVPGLSTGSLETHLLRERARLESAIRTRTRTPVGVPGPAAAGASVTHRRPSTGVGDSQTPFDPRGFGAERGSDVRELLRELTATTRLVELVGVEGRLQVLVCGDGRVRRYAAGDLAEATHEVDFARFGLDRFARGEPGEPPADAVRALSAAGQFLQELLLGEAADHLGDGPVVIVPPGRLHAVPWALLPVLRDRVFCVNPSARAWLTGRKAAPCGRTRVLVYGPGLARGRAEVGSLAAKYGGATVLGDGTATVERVVAALDGARLAHVAAHGIFRADSPMFSALLLDDGPLTGYDLERLYRAPYQLILPACESGVQAPAGADELLGLAAALLPRGTSGIVASVVRVNDDAASRVMLALHEFLIEGEPLSAALLGARLAVAGDPAAQAASWSFVALGA